MLCAHMHESNHMSQLEWFSAAANKASHTRINSDPTFTPSFHLPFRCTGAQYETEVVIHADEIAPTVTWGTSPQACALDSHA